MKMTFVDDYEICCNSSWVKLWSIAVYHLRAFPNFLIESSPNAQMRLGLITTTLLGATMGSSTACKETNLRRDESTDGIEEEELGFELTMVVACDI